MKRRLLTSVFLALITVTLAYGQKAKYVFYFIGDGMGINHVNGAEMYGAAIDGRIGVNPLCFTQFPISGFSTTYSHSSPITDSAAAGTALACGKKTNNGTLGMDSEGNSPESVAVKAKNAGKKVGIASSVSIDHATPAAFFAHQKSRSMYYEVATDLPKAGFDFYAGGGFLNPNKEGEISAFKLFEDAGYTLARGYDEYLEHADANKMILIQKEDKPQDAIPYAIDAEEDDLTLEQITTAAIQSLTNNNNKGFFLMIESGKIDWASHGNDASTALQEVIDFDKSIQIAYNFYKKHPKETLIIVTADHETGGLGLATNGFGLNYKVLSKQTLSQDKLSNKIADLRHEKNNEVSWEDIKDLLEDEVGLWDELTPTWEQEKYLRDEYEQSFVKKKIELDENLYAKNEPLASKVRAVVNQLAGIGWTTGGHSAAQVPVYAIGAGSELFMGSMDNTDIPKRISKAARY